MKSKTSLARNFKLSEVLETGKLAYFSENWSNRGWQMMFVNLESSSEARWAGNLYLTSWQVFDGEEERGLHGLNPI
jgi:hypothetical protein